MLIVMSRLPAQWQSREAVMHLQNFLMRFLDTVLTHCKEILGDSKKMVTPRTLSLALTRAGWSHAMTQADVLEKSSVTQTCVQRAVTASHIYVKQETRQQLRTAAQQLVDALVTHATPFQKAVKTRPAQIVRQLRVSMAASVLPEPPAVF